MSDDLTITLAEKSQDSSLQELFEDYRSNMVEQSFIDPAHILCANRMAAAFRPARWHLGLLCAQRAARNGALADERAR